MPIVFAAITPHSPLLLPTIGRENLDHLAATRDAFSQLAEEVYLRNVETLLIVSPHGPVRHGSFVMNLAPEYSSNLEKFGDFSPKQNYPGDLGLAHRIRESFETIAPLQMISDAMLDYGTQIPLELLSSSCRPRVIPLYVSTADLQDHFDFGKLLQSRLISSDSRVGIIASGDLSHRLSAVSPAGYSPKAEKFDRKLVEILQKNRAAELLNLNETLISEVSECGLKPISVLLGALDGLNVTPQKLSYEAPFGVGYLTLKYRF